MRLRDGRTVEGQVIREDEAQVVVIVSGQAQAFATADVTAVVYSHLRLSPATRARPLPAPDAPTAPALGLVEKIRERLLVYHGFMQRVGQVIGMLQADRDQAAYVHAQRAALWLLPLHRGQFSPYSTLADIVILLGLRAPMLWLALWAVRDRRAWTRLLEYLVATYAFSMLLLTIVLTAPSLQVQVVTFSALCLGAVGLCAWMLGLGPRKTVLTFLLALALNAGAEYALVAAGHLSGPALLARI